MRRVDTIREQILEALVQAKQLAPLARSRSAIREEIVKALAYAEEIPRANRIECIADVIRSLRLEKMFTSYLSAKFGKKAIADLSDDELRECWQYAMTLRDLVGAGAVKLPGTAGGRRA